MTVGAQDARDLLAVLKVVGAKQKSGDKVPRHALKVDFFHRESVTTRFAEDHWIEWCFLRHRPKTSRNEDSVAQFIGSRLPRTLTLWDLKWKVTIEVFGRVEP